MRNYVDLALMEREAKRRNISVGDEELKAAAEKELAKLKTQSGPSFEAQLKNGYLFTEENLLRIIKFGKRRELLMERTVKAWLLEPERCKQEIEKRFAQRFRRESEYFRARRITLEPTKDMPDTEVLAKSIAADIKAGKITFEDAAKQYSTDRLKDNGGDMGYFTPEQYASQAALMKALRGLKPGEVSEPFKTDMGWNIVKLEARHDANTIELKDVEAYLRTEIEREPPSWSYGKFVEELRKSAEIVIDLK
jgi:parvulin-like peptidyl-prolyl isomerase